MGIFCQVNDRWFEWSNNSDRPLTDAMSRDEFIGYIACEYGMANLKDNFRRMKKAEETGTSHMLLSLDNLLDRNRAGPNEEPLSRAALLQLIEND